MSEREGLTNMTSLEERYAQKFSSSISWYERGNNLFACGRGFLVSSAHDTKVIDHTIEAFSQSLKDLREEGEV